MGQVLYDGQCFLSENTVEMMRLSVDQLLIPSDKILAVCNKINMSTLCLFIVMYPTYYTIAVLHFLAFS